jgi:endonuclease III
MAQQSKAQHLNEIHTLLKRRYKPKPDRSMSRLPVLEAVIYGICHEGTTREQANQALSRFKDGFFDWNEVRVSTISEVQDALADLPDSEPRAQKIRRFLRQLFEKTYGFTLEVLTKKPLKESLKVLSEYEAFASAFVEATVVQLSLGGHAIPVDEPSRRALVRLGIADTNTDTAALRSLLERAVPKNRGVEFVELVEELAHDTCVEDDPDCPHCELRKTCPTAATRKEEAAAAAKQAAVVAKQALVAAKQPPAGKEAGKLKEKEKKSKEVETTKPTAKPSTKAAQAPAPPKAAPKTTRPAKERPGGSK